MPDRSPITHRDLAVPWEDLLDWAQNQNAGGGRMNWVVAGRKISDDSESEVVSAAVAKTGADETVWVLSPT